MRKKVGLFALSVAMLFSMTGCLDEEYEEGGEFQSGYSDEYNGENNGDYSGEYASEYSDGNSGEYANNTNEGGNGYSDSQYAFDWSEYERGLAGELEGDVIIFSIFANGTDYSWDFNSETDNETEGMIYSQLKIAAEYLEKEASGYGKNLNLIYDWSQDNELAEVFTVNFEVAADENYDAFCSEIDQNLAGSIIGLQKKYGTKNVVIMQYVNTPADYNQTSSTMSRDLGDPYVNYEICKMFTKECGGDEPAAAYAHELLHAFGAPDYYMADTDGSNQGLTQEFVDAQQESGSNQLMYTVYLPDGSCDYSGVTNGLDEMTAYYIGWTDHSETVDSWGFRQR